MKMNLKQIQWKEFYLKQFFEFERGNQNNMASLEDGSLPLVSAKNGENGYKKFVSENGKRKFPKSCLTLNNDGDGGAGISYFQPFEFLLDNHVTALFPKKNLSKHSLLFISRCITNQKGKFGHGYSINNRRIKVFKLMLPIDSNGEPDFEFMESFMKQKEQEKINLFVEHLRKKLKEIGEPCKVEPLGEKKWSDFFLRDVFKGIKRGRRFKRYDQKKGIIPYVSSTAYNNGVDNYIARGEKNVRIFSNCLTIANSGSVGACFYQPFEFIASDHVTQLKNDQLDKYTYRFIATILKRLGSKYSFNREMSDKRIKREKILLPINENQEPDYSYMKNYMRRLEYLKLKEYLDFKFVNL